MNGYLTSILSDFGSNWLPSRYRTPIPRERLYFVVTDTKNNTTNAVLITKLYEYFYVTVFHMY